MFFIRALLSLTFEWICLDVIEENPENYIFVKSALNSKEDVWVYSFSWKKLLLSAEFIKPKILQKFLKKIEKITFNWSLSLKFDWNDFIFTPIIGLGILMKSLEKNHKKIKIRFSVEHPPEWEKQENTTKIKNMVYKYK